MTEKFVASNGMYLADGVVYTSGGMKLLGRPSVESLREIFLAERDRELGRWRDPLNKSCVIYPMGNLVGGLRTVQVVNEDHGFCGQVNEGDPENMEIRVSAARYFAAHPEPKPEWHDAKPGEVWAIVTDNVAKEVAVQRTPNGLWQFCDGVVRDDKLQIVSARRVWPVSDV